MCGPAIPIIGLALTAVSTYSSLQAQEQQKQMQTEANQRQYDNSMTAYRGNLANIEVQRNQMGQDVTQKVNENNAAARAAKATASVSAGESGVSGLSVDALLRDLAGEASYDNVNVETNYLRQNTALNSRRENAYRSTASEINSLKTPVNPDYLGAGLRLGQAGLTAYGNYKQQDAIIRGSRS